MKIYVPLLAGCLILFPRLGLAVPITVEVTDEKGAPIAGALVLVQPFAKVGPDETTKPQRTTGADGLAIFDLNSADYDPNFYGRSVVYRAGYGLGGGDLKTTKSRVSLRAPGERSGRVTDFAGVPVAGAKVELTSVRDAGSDPFDGKSVLLGDESYRDKLAAQTQTTTDANGVWRLKDLPVNSEFGLTITADNFVNTWQQIKVVAGEVETKLAPEARINGQLLAPDQTPLAGVTVRVVPKERFERQGGEAITDAQGKFAVRGLSAASYAVYFKIEDQPFLAPKIDDFGARVGDNALPTVAAQTGVVVRGRVRDKEGQPVVTTVSANRGQQRAKTDKDGAYEIRVLPGENVFSLDVGNNYSNARDKQTLQIAADAAPVLDWTLQVAPLVRGIITDEKGAPLQAKLYLTGAMSNDVIEIQSDETGKFEAPAPFEGEATFGDSIWDSAQWDVVGRQTVKLPLRGELKLTVKPTVRRIFQTRVVDENGAPVVGAQFDANVWEGQSGRGTKIFSDADGILLIKNITPKQSITNPTIAKDGYQLRGELKVIDGGGDITTAPIIMVKSAGTARGTVINAAGQSAARARVAAAGVEAIADENGAFTLDNLPAGELRIAAIAADEQSYGAAKLPLQGPISLRTPQLIGRDRDLAQSVMSALKAETKETDYWAKDRLDFPVEDFVARVRNSADAVVPFYDLDTDGSISTARALEAFALLNQSDDVLRAAAQIVSWRTDWKDDARAGEFVARLEEDVANERGKAANANSIYNAAGVFALAAAYEEQGANESADRAFKTAIDWTFATFALTGDQGRETAMMFSAPVFAGAPRLMEKLLTFFDPESYYHHRALVETLEPMARARGLSALAPAVEKVSQLPDSRETTMLDRKTSYYVQGNLLPVGIKIIRDNGERDAAGALQIAELMRENPDFGQSDERNRAFAEAAFWQSAERATQIWREQLLTMKPENAISYAARIQAVNPDLARELYGVAREQFEAKLPLADSRKDISSISFFSIEIGKFAYYEAQFEPARARYRIERAWSALDNDNQNYGKLRDLVAAMGRLDPQRALEMAGQIATRDRQFEARRNLSLQLWSGQMRRDW